MDRGITKLLTVFIDKVYCTKCATKYDEVKLKY